MNTFEFILDFLEREADGGRWYKATPLTDENPRGHDGHMTDCKISRANIEKLAALLDARAAEGK